MRMSYYESRMQQSHVFCQCPSGLFFPPEEVAAARERVRVKRAIRRAIAPLGFNVVVR